MIKTPHAKQKQSPYLCNNDSLCKIINYTLNKTLAKMKTKLLLAAGLCTAMFSFWGCQNDDEVVAPEQNKTTETEIEQAFDYKLTQSIPVNVEYPQMAYFEVFDQLPAIDVKATRIYSAFTDKDGKLEGQVTLAKSYIGQTVYAICYYPGCPLVTEATVTADGLFFKASTPTSRAVSQENKVTVPSDLIAKIETQLPEHKDNSKFIDGYTDTKNIDVRIKEKCTIDVTFVRAQGWYDATLYYFVYRDEMPSKSSILRNYINNEHKVFGPYNSYTGKPNSNKWSEKHTGETVRLSNGTTNDFTEGDHIGFVLVSDPQYVDNTEISHQFSYKEYNTQKKAQAARFVYTAADSKQCLVYAYEDVDVTKYQEGHWAGWGDWNPGGWYPNGDRDYNDLIFMVKATPYSAIDDPEIKPLPEVEKIIGTEQISGTLLFEDNYPEAGDYDMNDFVTEYTLVKHYYSMSDGSVTNQLEKLEYYFTPKWDGAWNGATFGFMVDGFVKSPVKIYTMEENETMGALEAETIHNEIEVAGNKDDLSWEAFNPFITVKNTGREVHLTKKSPSPNANLDGLDEYAKNYVLKNSKFPYAMNIPTSEYNIVEEKVRIDSYYPKYVDWVESDGENGTDWFNHPLK